MPRAKDTHLNLGTGTGKTRCGLKLERVKWSDDKTNVTCRNCLKAVGDGHPWVSAR